MSLFHRNLVISGLGGLLFAGFLAAVSTWLMCIAFITPPLPYQAVTLVFVLIFGGFSLAEIPLMVFTMRRLAAERQDNSYVVWGLNAFYVFFAAVYGAPVLLLTGNVGWGLALCGLALLRFCTSLLFVHEP